MINKKVPTFEYELKYSMNKKAIIAGVDEVGRGALAGPIVAAAVVFKNYEKIIQELSGINDSKILTPTKRLEYDELIKSKACNFAIGLVDASEIDHYGIGSANVMAFQRALDGLEKCNFVLIDGRRFRGFDYEYVCLEKGESKSISIAAASIIAKVYRDALMQEIHDEIFKYDFASNKGYGSKNHMQALEKFGPSKYHRRTFLNKFNEHLSQNSLF
ncbi:MAG: ribonuclease HII [Patescibacteria group bacterium]|nr:ribonuclease HII [Patescibacteria group bacterium]